MDKKIPVVTPFGIFMMISRQIVDGIIDTDTDCKTRDHRRPDIEFYTDNSHKPEVQRNGYHQRDNSDNTGDNRPVINR